MARRKQAVTVADTAPPASQGAIVIDGLQSLVSSFGAPGRDKASGVAWNLSRVGWEQCELAFNQSWIARQICRVPAEDATRRWRTWSESIKTRRLLEKEERRHGLIGKVRQALTWARASGGAALILDDGADPSQPLLIERMRQGGLVAIRVASRRELTPVLTTGKGDEIVPSLDDPSGYTPAFWTYHSRRHDVKQERVHHSRVVRICGETPLAGISGYEDGANRWWGESALVTPLEAINHAHLASSSAAAMIQEATVDVLTLKGMKDIASPKAEADLKARLLLTQQLKGILSILALAEGETFNRNAANFAGLPDTVQTLLGIAAAAADIPATRLLSISPAGMNATGDSDMKNYFQMVHAQQTTYLEPALYRVDQAIIQSALGKIPEDLIYEWEALNVLTPKEWAETMKIEAEAAEVLIRSGAVRSDLMARAMEQHIAARSQISGFEAILEDMGPVSDDDFDLDEPEDDPAPLPAAN